MILSVKEAKDLVKKPRNSRLLQRARYQESRLKFHAEVYESKDVAPAYYTDFKDWVKGILTATDKYDQFVNLLTFPIKTNSVVDKIADEYAKVFNSQNSYIGVEFSDSAIKQKYMQYTERCGDKEFWRKDVFNAMLTAINSIMVVDLKVEQEGDNPEPYYYLLSIDRVIDVHADSSGKIEYLIFSDGPDRVIVFDDTAYRVFSKKDNQLTLKVTSPHTLGYTPAAFMWNDCLESTNSIVKQGPISAQQSDLDWLLFVMISKRCLDIYASFPIYWHFRDKCQISECTGGFISYEMADGSNGIKACPSCSKNSLIGAGSVVKIDSPRNSESPDLRNPIGVVPAEEASLKYNVDEVERLEAAAIESATGKLSEKYRTTGPINEDQVHSNYESQTNILRYIAQNFEKAQSWIIQTTARLMFGEKYLGCTVNYGTDFYLQSQNDVTVEYQAAKEAGLPFYILQAKRNQVDELQSKNNPKERERLVILRQLEPFQDISLDVLISLGIPAQNPEKFAIKLYFTNFVNKFELENGNIVEWGSALDFSTKIARINQEFLKYTKDEQTSTGNAA